MEPSRCPATPSVPVDAPGGAGPGDAAGGRQRRTRPLRRGRVVADDDRRRCRSCEVSRRTVFTSVGGKAALLKLALDWALVGDDEPVPLSERPVIAEMERLTDPRALVARWAQFVAELEERAAPLPPYSSWLRTSTRKPPPCTQSPNVTGSGAHSSSWPVSRQSAGCDRSHHRARRGRRPGAHGPCRPPHARGRARLAAHRVRRLDRAHGRGRVPRGYLEGGMTGGVPTILGMGASPGRRGEAMSSGAVG